MVAQVVDLWANRQRAARSALGWRAQERAELARAAAVLQGRLGPLETAHGLTDQFEPWAVLFEAETGEVLAHFARIDGRFVACLPQHGVMLDDVELRRAIDRTLAVGSGSALAPDADPAQDGQRTAKVVALFAQGPRALAALLIAPALFEAFVREVRAAEAGQPAPVINTRSETAGDTEPGLGDDEGPACFAVRSTETAEDRLFIGTLPPSALIPSRGGKVVNPVVPVVTAPAAAAMPMPTNFVEAIAVMAALGAERVFGSGDEASAQSDAEIDPTLVDWLSPWFGPRDLESPTPIGTTGEGRDGDPLIPFGEAPAQPTDGASPAAVDGDQAPRGLASVPASAGASGVPTDFATTGGEATGAAFRLGVIEADMATASASNVVLGAAGNEQLVGLNAQMAPAGLDVAVSAPSSPTTALTAQLDAGFYTMVESTITLTVIDSLMVWRVQSPIERYVWQAPADYDHFEFTGMGASLATVDEGFHDPGIDIVIATDVHIETETNAIVRHLPDQIVNPGLGTSATDDGMTVSGQYTGTHSPSPGLMSLYADLDPLWLA